MKIDMKEYLLDGWWLFISPKLELSGNFNNLIPPSPPYFPRYTPDLAEDDRSSPYLNGA